MQIGRAGCNACNGILALQAEHRRSLQLAKVREGTECKWQSSINPRIQRGFEPTTNLGIGNTAMRLVDIAQYSTFQQCIHARRRNS